MVDNFADAFEVQFYSHLLLSFLSLLLLLFFVVAVAVPRSWKPRMERFRWTSFAKWLSLSQNCWVGLVWFRVAPVLTEVSEDLEGFSYLKIIQFLATKREGFEIWSCDWDEVRLICFGFWSCDTSAPATCRGVNKIFCRFFFFKIKTWEKPGPKNNHYLRICHFRNNG